jgi:hypothetical protein
MPELDDEILGRIEFDKYRSSMGYSINYDWADMSATEKQMYIDKAKENKR